MKTRRLIAILTFALTLTLLLAVSCGQGETVRKYKEKEKETAATHFQWQTPEGWSEDGAASGFRLAAFTIKSQNSQSTALCTIVPLQGEAGGLRANIERWLGQINGGTLPADAVERLLKGQENFLTAGQFPAVLIDFTALTINPRDKSILAAVISVSGNSIFIKMTGEKFLLMENKEKFKALCQSFTL